MNYKADDIIEFKTTASKSLFGRIFCISFDSSGKFYHITNSSNVMKIRPNQIKGLIREQQLKITSIEDLYI